MKTQSSIWIVFVSKGEKIYAPFLTLDAASRWAAKEFPAGGWRVLPAINPN